MWEILTIFCLGLFAGLALKNRVKIQKAVQRLTDWTIYLLLFFLGVAVGLNKTIIDNIGSIGFYGILISLIGIFFSIVIANLLYFYFFRDKNEK